MQGGQPSLIIVDDEADLRAMVAEYLGKQGFSVATANGGAELDARLEEGKPDLILLDVNMPGEDGFSIARRVRGRTDIPIIMLTAAEEVVDRVVGLEIGADDYITKPFDLREVRARIRSVLRRVRLKASAAPEAAPAGQPPAPRAPFGRVWLDLDGRCLVRPDGEQEMLTAMEFDLLAAFARNPHRVLSRDRLLDLAHHRGWEPFDRSIDIRVTRIRKKIEVDPAKPQVIKTVRGAGYIYVPSKSVP